MSPDYPDYPWLSDRIYQEARQSLDDIYATSP